MVKTLLPHVSQIVLPAAKPEVQIPPLRFVAGPILRPREEQWAPAWFYSALNWLGKPYYDGAGVQQSFSAYMAGSDVDPYSQIGSTRLFMIFLLRDTFRLTLARDANSTAPGTGGTSYPNTDDGIKAMYAALAASSIFPAIKYCYIPGRLGADFSPVGAETFAAVSVSALQSGYDPASGLRIVVLGSAVSQIVPLDDFARTHNEQVYNDDPVIVPIVSSLVYDVTQNNVMGATTFTLPLFYSRDQVTSGQYYVNKVQSTAVFSGGPGYDDTTAIALKLDSTATSVNPNGPSFTTYTYDTAKVTTISALGARVDLGVVSLTYAGVLPSSIFSNQRIIGFYRDNKWLTCLGVPIYDFGTSNASFTANAAALPGPVVLYDPTHPFLNGGSLQNVLHKLMQATYVYPTDRLQAILNAAIAAKGTDQGVGLSVTTAAMDFNMSSTPASAIVDQLTLPIAATVTTTPPVLQFNPRRDIRTNLAAQFIGTISLLNLPTPAPVMVQLGLTASIPREALDGTGITSIEIGTPFPQQPLGAGGTLQAETAGTVINLMDRHLDVASFLPVDLTLATAGVTFNAGIYYVLSLSGSSLTVRGSDGSSVSATPALPGNPDPNHTYVGATVYAAGGASVRLYPKLQLTTPAPAVGAYGVVQGAPYSVRLTFGDANSLVDIIDSTQSVVEANISVPNPAPSDGSKPQQGDVYFGAFIGGAAQMTVWSVPVFLTVVPSQLTGASFNGAMTLEAQSSGLPSYQLQITDSSLFVYSNINVDTSAIGSVSPKNVYIASAVINSSPDDLTSSAFAPCRLLLGLVRQVQMGTGLKYVFVPEDDSVVIGGTRYMVSVVELDNLDVDPNSRPYPPVFWPQTRYWQFANRHNPYIDVEYTGNTQPARISQAQADTARIGLQAAKAQEPMQLYLDTDQMTVWPIFAFPFETSTQTVDQGQLKTITDTILGILNISLPAPPQFVPGPLDAEQISVPGFLQQGNPYTADVATTVDTNPVLNQSIEMQTLAPVVSGLPVTQLRPGFVADTSIKGASAQQSLQLKQVQEDTANLAFTKSFAPEVEVMQVRATSGGSAIEASSRRRYQPIYGFSVFNPGTGEAYIVEVVEADLAIPDRLPLPNTNRTYDPYYVRVVLLNTMTCYNMSIIVPAMVHDQYGHLARQAVPYQNILSKTNELALGYMYSLYDAANNFDNLTFSPYPAGAEFTLAASQTAIFTNVPYSTKQTSSFSPISLFSGISAAPAVFQKQFVLAAERDVISATRESFAIDLSDIVFRPIPVPPAYFVCRRLNWSTDCHLMQATHPAGTSIYLGFGGGDIVPFRLDADFNIDKRQPAHMYKLTTTFADREYDSVKTISVANKPYVVAVTTAGGVTQYMNFSINATAGTADLQIASNQPLSFPTECYVAGQASATLISIADINTQLGTGFASTGDFMTMDANGNVLAQEFQLIPYNNLVYMIRAVANVPALAAVGGLGTTSGLLVDTFVPSTTGNLVPAQGARHKRSGLSYFGSTYTATTMVDTLDNLDFTSITGETFYVPTIFVPIPEIDATKGFVADLSNFLGQQIWTLIYPEIVAQRGTVVNGVSYPNGFNLDGDGKPVLTLQKLQFVYDPLVVMFTPNDLAHKYPLQPKQQVLALTNGQIQEGICWRSANLQPLRLPPSNVCAQQILPQGDGMDRPNIVYSSHNRPVMTSIGSSYMGMSVNSLRSVSGVVYNIEESALSGDQTGSSFISAVATISNMLIGVLFDYDNNDLGTLSPYDVDESSKGVVFINGYLGATGYTFSSPDHFDVNDVLPSQVPLLEQISGIMGENWDVAFYNTDVSRPRQFWSLVYDTFTAAGLPNFIANVPPAAVDPTFTNRTRSLILSLQNPVRPTQLGLMDTYSSVVSANLHLENGVTGSVFLSKKADRDVASIGTNPVGPNSFPLFGLPTKYDFFIFSRDHYWTLKGAIFELVDMGYAMCLVDDGSGTGTKVAKYFIDSDGNYNELYSYALYSPNGGIIETSVFTLKVTLGAPANLSATPIIPETPNNANPQDLVAQINKISNVIYAAFGPSSSGQPPAYIPIQAVGGEIQAAPILGAPGVNGYSLNVVGANRQPIQISQIFSGTVAYAIAGSTTIIPINPKSGKAVPFSGSLANGLDRMVPVTVLPSADLSSFIPRPTVPAGPAAGMFGGNGLGALVGTQFSCAFQGAGAIPPAIAANPTPGTTMKADDTVFYTYNAVANTVMDSTGKPVTPAGGQYFIDVSDPLNPIYAVVTLPKFTLNGNTYNLNLSTTLPDGVTSRYSLVVGGKSYLFAPDDAHVTVDRTTFTFNPLAGGIYTVTYASVDNPAGNQAPTPITLTPFSVAAGGLSATIDVFNNPGGLQSMILGVAGRQYTYDPVHGTVTIFHDATTTTVALQTGLTFTSTTFYGYVIGFNGRAYTVNGAVTYPYSAATTGTPATYNLMTSPQMFTIAGNFYTFDQDSTGAYVNVTGNGQAYPVNPYQFSINGVVYIINTHVQPNTVVGGGNVYTMTAANTQFLLNGVQYTIALKQNSLNGATISGQFNVTQGNVVVIENYVYQLDALNGQIVGNGTTYPLTTSGVTYTITTTDRSFTVTTEPNAATVTIGNITYLINNTTVVGDGVTYPILAYRTVVDGAAKFNIGLDGTVSISPPFSLSGASPWVRATFTDGDTFTVNDVAAFDGTQYYLMPGTPAQFTANGLTYTVRTDGVSLSAGPSKTYIVAPSGPLSPNQFTFGTKTIFFGRATDLAAFDGSHYYAIANNQFTDTNTGLTYTLSGNTAVNQGNSYEIFSNLGQGSYFEVPDGPTYYVNMTVADTGSATGDIFNVFPIASGQFTLPVQYTLTVSGTTVTVNAETFTGGPVTVSTLTALGGKLTGGFFQDPVTKIVYTCVVDGPVITFVDSNNAVFPYPAAGSTNTFVATVVAATAVTLAVDNQVTPAVYPVLNNQFVAGGKTYNVNVPVAYTNAAAGPYWPMVNGRFIVPKTDPVSPLAYTVRGGSVIKGYVISEDDEFSPDGNVVYTVNAVNVVKATNQASFSGAEPNQTLVAGPLTYALNTTTSQASIVPAGLTYDTGTKKFKVNYNALAVTYTVGTQTVTDDRNPMNTFPASITGTQLTFSDTASGVTFTFDQSGNNPITAAYVYTNHFFVDVINGATYYIDEADNRVEAISYLPETTQYAFVAADGKTYLIHYNNVSVVFPVISGPNVDAGVATVGSDTFTVHVDEVDPVDGGAGVPINLNSFEINGNLYTITGTPVGNNYSSCKVVGDLMAPKQFSSPNTFQLSDPAVTYTLQLDSLNLPVAVLANFAVRPSRDLITVNDNVYIVTYNTVTTGSLLGQGQASIAISNSSFTLSNPFDTTKAKFIFADLNIYDAASVVGQFTVYLAPTFFISAATYTLDPVNLVVTDNNKRPYPLLPNPTMFSINGFNYVIDSNRIPHAIVGNNNVSPLATDVTVLAGHPIPNSTFTLNGLIYKYTEDAAHNLLTITGTKSYMVTQPTLTFKLDSSLIFTIVETVPAAGNYPGSFVPIGTITSGTLIINLYAGTPESGGADFFTYKNVLYTMVKSEGVYVAIQKSYTVYASKPVVGQQQLAVFDLNGTTYMVTDGTTAGIGTAAGINPGSMWSATSISNLETQFGLVYGFAAQPTNVVQSGTGVFQFAITDANGNSTLYDILYTAGANSNMVKVDVPALLPTFTQSAPFAFTPSYPLTFETGGYNAFTTFVEETSTPSESFAGAYKTPVTSTDALIDTLISAQGDFSLEFWHSLPLSTPSAYRPFTYTSSTSNPLVYYVDVDFDDSSNIYLGINNTFMQASTTPPVFSSAWRHFALTYNQPYVMLCAGAGFEVKQASNFNFEREFSIAMTFSASDVNSEQGLLYKGTGSDLTSPLLSMSYRVEVKNGAVTLRFTDGKSKITPEYTGPAIEAGKYYQVIIVKRTLSPADNSDSSDPYAPPFDVSALGPAAKNGGTFSSSAMPTSGTGSINISNIAPATGATPKLDDFLKNIQAGPSKAYTVTIALRTIFDDGTFGPWKNTVTKEVVDSDAALTINPTGSAHLLIGAAYSDDGEALPMGGSSGTAAGNVRKVYLFNAAINPEGIPTNKGVVDIDSASAQDLVKAGIVGYWTAAYDPDGVVNSPYDPNAVAISTNTSRAYLAPLTGHELEAAALYIDGVNIPLTLVTGEKVPDALAGYSPGLSLLTFNAGLYKLEEISMWCMARQPYQIIDDMFGRLIPTNEPFLIVYLSGAFLVQAINAPILPMNKYIDHISIVNPIESMNLTFSSASLDLSGCPAVGRCGPLVTPNLYTPPGVALAVCDTVPYLTTYSVTLNSVTGTLAGEVNEAYVYVKDHILTLYAGKKVGDLVLSWVSQEQGNVQLIGYVEGAPPCPMANLTNKASYAGATSVTFTAPTSVTLKYQVGNENSTEDKFAYSVTTGAGFGFDVKMAPVGFGIGLDKKAVLNLTLSFGAGNSNANSTGGGSQTTASEKLDESNKYTVKMQGTLSAFTGDLFMSSLNTLTTPSTTVGNPSSKTAILPNPNLGGFTTSNPPGQLPKTAPTEEMFGQRIYVPSPYGEAFVTSQTLDVYQQTLLQTNTVYGFIRIPNAQIPRDFNIVSFRISSKYLRPGCLDGVVGYVYNPATLPTGAQTYTTSTGQMKVLNDKNFSAGEVGHDASYMRIVEAYQIKKQIDQQAFNALALYQAAFQKTETLPDATLTPGLDFYNEYVWSSRGGTQEIKHTYSTTYDEVYTTSTASTFIGSTVFNFKLSITTVSVSGKFTWSNTIKNSTKYSYNTTATSSFDVAASFDGIETDTQMRYSSANDAHFVMNFNSMFNPNNQSGLNLVIGSDGLVYNIVPSVSSGAGLPLSDNIDDSQTYTQPQPAYTSGNANGLTGALEPYDRPGKTKLFRTYAFFLQPTKQNADNFWNTVVDPVWLANSPDSDADAMRSAMNNPSLPWRLLYRVTYSERFLPPISTEAVVVPQITPVMAVPVLNPASDFLFKDASIEGPRPLHNPANDIEANIVLAAPTASGLSAGTVPKAGPSVGLTILPNNVIPFDLVKGITTVANWGDSANLKLLTQLTTSVLGLNTVLMSNSVPPQSTKMADILDPVNGGPLYSVYTDPNGLVINVPVNFGVTVYQDVNGNPIQYFDGKTFHSLQSDYIATTDGTVMYYIQPPSTYDQSVFDPLGDYDPFGHPGDEWRYYLVSGFSANMTSEPTVAGIGPFLSSTGASAYTGFTVATSQHSGTGLKQVQGYVLVQGILQWPHLNTNAETFADVLVYKAMSLLDTFPIGDPEVLISFLKAQYPKAPFVSNDEINLVFARNIVSFFNSLQLTLIPQ